jgi:hypothetical protein
MRLNKKDILPFTGISAALPNDSNGPSTNEDAKKSIVHHGFEKYSYMKDAHFTSHFPSYGKGMAQDGSPIPDTPDNEGGHGFVSITVDFFGSIFKEYDHNGAHIKEKLGKMEGINKEDDIVFTDGEMLDGDNRFGILQVLCGFEEHIVDYHVHSGHDNRITVHSPHACPSDMDIPYHCTYSGVHTIDDEQLKHEFGIEMQCKCHDDAELCRCIKKEEGYSHEDMTWCDDWFNLADFSHDMHDDHEHDDHEHDDHDEPTIFSVKADALKKGSILAKFSTLKGKAKDISMHFLHKKHAEQQKLARKAKRSSKK